MKKLLVILALVGLPFAAQANGDEYYDRVCQDSARYSHDMEIWCNSFHKHKEHDESTKNDKENIEKLDKEMHGGRVDAAPSHAARYDDWDAREREDSQPAPAPGYYR